MCLAIPGKVLSVAGLNGIIELGGVQRRTSLQLVPKVKVGDYVMVHAGFAITIISKEDHDIQCELLREAREKAQALFGDDE